MAHNVDNDLLKQFLRKAIEHQAGYRPISSPDFVRLADDITATTHEYISPTTLKRLWGYVKEPVNPRPSILNLLARYLNYANANEMFIANGLDQSALSGQLDTPVIYSGSLPEGALVSISWYPDREIKVRHLHDSEFEIVEVSNSRVKAGATFTCPTLVDGRPLLLNNYLEAGDEGERLTYECGRSGGVKCRVIDSE